MTSSLTKASPFFLVALLTVSLSACGEDSTTHDPELEASFDDSEAPLGDLDLLLEGAPDPDTLPSEPKADQIFPKQFDLVSLQSPVRSQGKRGVCSIFSTIALMEHLYIKEGTHTIVDFSEQFLQWSVKVELGAFQNTIGSNASRNLAAINQYGIVQEIVYPYDPLPWTTNHDERCTGDDRPTICYTNGNPSDSIKNSKRWFLPQSRWVSNRTNSIKAYIFEKRAGVLAGGQFFYQSWNHRKSTLPTNREYWNQGYVLSPNEKDIEISGEKRAGHSILLVGWDDALSVPIVDADGQQVLDADGNPTLETGFFLFKNSWGTSGFGVSNPHGAGYGWIAMRYVERYLSVNGAGVPEFGPRIEICDDGVDNNSDDRIDCADPTCSAHEMCQPVEVCDDQLDNDDNGQIDCDDPACAETPACTEPVEEGILVGSNQADADIPDNTADGLSSPILIEGEGKIAAITVSVDITHAYRGDLVVELVHPEGTAVTLHNRAGRNAEDLVATYQPTAFNDQLAPGEWLLNISDHARLDTGHLNAWSLRIELATP